MASANRGISTHPIYTSITLINGISAIDLHFVQLQVYLLLRDYVKILIRIQDTGLLSREHTVRSLTVPHARSQRNSSGRRGGNCGKR